MKSQGEKVTANPPRNSGAPRIRRIFGAVAAIAIALFAFAGPAAAAPQGVSTTAAACPFGYFCIYSQPGYTGTQYNLFYCHDYPVTFIGVGSWYNNQTRGTRAVFTRADGSKYITPPAPVSYPRYDWTPIIDIKPC